MKGGPRMRFKVFVAGKTEREALKGFLKRGIPEFDEKGIGPLAPPVFDIF